MTVPVQTAEPARLEKAIDAYLEDYTCELDEGMHTPGEFEQFVIKDAIMGLLVDDEFCAALREGAVQPAILGMVRIDADGGRSYCSVATYEREKFPGNWHPFCLADNRVQPAEASPEPVAWRDVKAERERQVKVEGWTAEHDDTEHGASGLAAAAGCYALFADAYPNAGQPPSQWPWEPQWWKPKDFRRDQVRAAALLLAAIEWTDRHSERELADAPTPEQSVNAAVPSASSQGPAGLPPTGAVNRSRQALGRRLLSIAGAIRVGECARGEAEAIDQAAFVLLGHGEEFEAGLEPSEFDPSQALAGLIGWAQMILWADDMPPALRERFANSHRLTTALIAHTTSPKAP